MKNRSSLFAFLLMILILTACNSAAPGADVTPIINSPNLILADEPTAELDSGTAREILALFQEISQKEGITVLMVSHDGLVDEFVEEILTLKSGMLTEEET